MRRLRAAVLITASILAAQHSGDLLAQTAQRQVRDVRPEATGVGIISGVVQEIAEGNKPLRRAAVSISSDALLTARQVYTRDDGTFIFAGLPPGKYIVEVYRSGYMREQYGAKRAGGTGSAIVLSSGQRTEITLRLSRYASITGVIYDQNGEPAPGISVEALRYTMRTGRRTLASVYGQPSTTDDRGVYEIGGLGPGEYFIAAGPSPDVGPTDVQQLTAADVDRVLQFVGSPTPAASLDVSFTQPRQAFAAVYFPGTTEFSRAQTVALAVGEERSGVDIRLQLVRTARIDGTITTADGRPAAGVRVNAVAVTEATTLDLFNPGAIAPALTDADGRFAFPALAPGRYALSARTTAGQAGLPAAAAPLWASTEISIAGGDQSVALSLQPGVSVSGKVVFAGTSIPQPAPLSSVRVGISNLLTTQSAFFTDPFTVAPAAVTADSTFSMTGAVPGTYRVTSAPPVTPPGWFLRSALLNGVDALDMPIAVNAGQPIDSLVVTFTDRPTELSGTLQTPTGTPTADYFIIVFARDRALWTTSSRRNVMARPDSTGRYTIKNLPPGEYLIVAVTDVEYGDWWDPAFLERLSPGGTRLVLAESEKRTVDLKISGGLVPERIEPAPGTQPPPPVYRR